MINKHIFLTPFRYIDGFKALLLGLLVLVCCSLLSYYIGFRYDGFIDFHAYATQKNSYLFDPFISWLLFAIFTCATGWIFKKKFRIIDVLGMTALAYIPNIFLPIVAYSFNLSGISTIIGNASLIELPTILEPYIVPLVASGLLMLGITVWFIYYCYQAFRVNLNIKKGYSILIFIVLVLLTELTAIFILRSY